MGRLLGIDYGTKRIGLAVTDPLRLIASPLKTIKTGEFDAFVSEYLKTESIDAFIIGYPVQMNNKQSESVKYIKPFIRRLEKQFPSIPVHLVDERFTSKMALRSIIDGGVKKNDRKDKGLIDKTSAAIILRSFLDRKVN
jgi:putative Holliday junction resolvase